MTGFYPDMESAEESDIFTDEQYDARLETLAKLIEAKAKSVEEAAQIVRDAKIVSEDTNQTKNETSM